MIRVYPKPPYLRPNPQRLPKGKRMTIALGIVGTNGIVLAADTEETIPGYMKRSQIKIIVGHHHRHDSQNIGMEIDPDRPMVAVSGAGESDYLDSANAEMVDVIISSKKTLIREMKPELQSRLVHFYKDHVIPFAQFPDRPDISLIVAVAALNQAALWTSSRNRLKWCQEYGAVGIGAFYAQTLLNKFYRPFDAHVCCAIAVYVMRYVKEYVPDCGKETQIVCMRQGEMWRPYFRDVRDLEDAFGTYASIETDALHYVIGGLDESWEKDVRRWNKKARKNIMELTKKMMSQSKRGPQMPPECY
jgi:hypothetical protein